VPGDSNTALRETRYAMVSFVPEPLRSFQNAGLDAKISLGKGVIICSQHAMHPATFRLRSRRAYQRQEMKGIVTTLALGCTNVTPTFQVKQRCVLRLYQRSVAGELAKSFEDLELFASLKAVPIGQSLAFVGKEKWSISASYKGD
jgi:hypothetical protein